MSSDDQHAADPLRRLFEREGLEQCRNGARVFCAFCIAMLIVSGLYSWLYESEVFATLLLIRLSTVAAIAAAYGVLSSRYGARWAREIGVALILVTALNIFAIAHWTGGQTSLQYDRVAMVILSAAVMMTWSAAWAALAAGAVVLVYVAQSAAFGWLGGGPFTGNLMRMLAASGVAIGASIFRERRRWRHLAHVHALTEARRHADDEVRRLNAELEQRVLDRTAELRASEERARAMFEAARTHQGHLAHVLRVTSMGGMVVELAHELNQPLGAIVNFANGTKARLKQLGTDPELTDAVGRIADEGLRAAEIIRRVREFVRPGGTVRLPVDLNGVVREAALLIESEARGAGIPLQLRLDPMLPMVPADRIQLEQVILNLFRNAIEAMSASDACPHELLVQTQLRSADEIELSVRDTGVGVAPEAAERIFEAFFTTKPGGLGMGLSISRTIIEAYGGRLWAKANADRGMTFGFNLPTHGVNQSAATETRAKASNA